MSYLAEQISYLSGLAEGMKLDETTNEGKLLSRIIEVLDDVAGAIEELAEIQDEMQEQIDAVDEDLADLEDFIYEDEDYDDFDDELECEGFECPNCGEELFLDASLLENDEESIICPNCGEEIELEFDDCGCGCEDCGHDD